MEITLKEFGNSALPINRDYDTFTRGDSDAPGVTEGAGAQWQIMGPSTAGWRAGIRGNRLSMWRSSLPAEQERAMTVVNTGKSNGIFSMRLDAIPGGAQGANGNFVVRVRDALNYVWIYANDQDKVWSIYRVQNGAVQRLALGAATAGYSTISVHLQGPLISVYADGILSAQVTYDNFLEATRHGIIVRATPDDTMTASRFDDFSFTDL